MKSIQTFATTLIGKIRIHIYLILKSKAIKIPKLSFSTSTCMRLDPALRSHESFPNPLKKIIYEDKI